MPGIDVNNARPPFEQIAEFYRKEIDAGRLKPGDQLPSVRDIATSFGVAVNTASNAIKTLKDDGHITSWQGKGIFVRDLIARNINPDDPNGAYSAIMNRLGEIHGEMQELADRVSKLEQSQPSRER